MDTVTDMTNAAASPAPEPGPPPSPRRLRRCPHHRMVAGVAAGVADYLDLDVSAVRLAFVVLTLVAGLGVPAYLAAWVLLPEEGRDDSLADDLAARWSRA